MRNDMDLKNLEPFNDFFYKTCFYNCFFPIWKYYNNKVEEFLSYDVYQYKINEKNGKIILDYEINRCKSFGDILNDYNIEQVSWNHSEDLINDIVESLKNNKLVILYIDYYYEPRRSDVYMKEHGQHTVLLYNYDLSKKTFYIMEHKNKESLLYEKQEISFDDIEKAYFSYARDFFNAEQDKPIINAFSIKNTPDSCKKFSGFHITKANYLKSKDETYEGLKKICEYRPYIIESFNSKEKIDENLKEFISMLNNIINVKQAERYRIEKYFPEEKILLDKLKVVMDSWAFIRNCLVKYQYMPSIWNNDYFKKVIYRYDEIYNEELEFHNMLIDRCIL